jgi:hypothetical protein
VSEQTTNSLSVQPSTAALPGQTPSQKGRDPFLPAAWLSASLASLLVLSELLAADTAVVWSIGGILKFTTWQSWLALAIGAGISLWVSALFFRSALAGETGLIRDRETRPVATRDSAA